MGQIYFFLYFLMINRNDLTVHRTIKTRYHHALNQSATPTPASQPATLAIPLLPGPQRTLMHSLPN
jgi:hypothetical protein